VARFTPAAALLLLAASSGVQAQQADSSQTEAEEGPQVEVERLTGPVPAELAAFETTHRRFAVRMGEFRQDASDYVDLVESLKRRQIVDGYGRIIAGLRDDETALRTLAKARFEDFLVKYPYSEATPHVMFRLAELYYEETENNFLVADEGYNDLLIEYEQQIAALPPDVLDIPEPPPAPQKDYGRSADLYQRISTQYPSYENIDGVYYMMGYCYTEENALHPDRERGLAALQKLVDGFPDSEFANDANMRLGENYFDNNEIDKAILHYEAIVTAGEDARYFDKGLYKLAWSHYKLASVERFEEYTEALRLFTQLLDYSDRLALSTGEQSAMKPEAIDYAAISFADMGDHLKKSPLAVAEEFYSEAGEREYELDIYIKLADVLTRQARYDEAIQSYEYLQTRWPNNPENPEFQFKVAQLYMSLPVPDVEASAQAELVLADRYNDSTDWWQANRANPDALAVASGYTERSLANVAKDFHFAAQESGLPEDFSRAADKYREYLLRFPFADDYYEMEWYLADALFNARRLDEAEKEFLQLLKTDAHPYGDGSLFKLMQARRQKLIDKYGKVEARPDDAIVERTVTTEQGAEIPVYMITDEHELFIEVADRIVDTRFTDQTYVAPRENNLAALHYLPAQIYFEFGHYDEARERFTEIIDLFPGRPEAGFAVALIVRTYQDENDLANVFKYAKELPERLAPVVADAGEEAASPEEINKVLADMQGLEEGSAFKLANQLAKEDRRAEAAAAFEQFCADYPESIHYKDAFFNQANNLERTGKVDEAIALFEQFINENPTDERSEGYYFRIAGNYAQILDLQTAIRYYDDLVRNFPSSENAAAAIYNAAFLRIGIGDHQGAARGLESYATRWPENEDAEKAFFLAGNEWEQVGERQALDFYRRYLTRYEGQDTNHALTAQYRIIKILAGLGQQRNADREWEELEAMFTGYAEAGETIAGQGRLYAAEGAFRALWVQFEEYQVVKFTGDQEHDAPLLVNEKPEQLKQLTDSCLAIIQKYKDFTHSSAALYIQAAAHFAYAQMLFDAPPPKGFTQEQIDFYIAELDKLRIPVEEKGKAIALKNLSEAAEAERWSEWQSLTVELLNVRFPQEFPAEKIERRYATQPSVRPTAGPLSIDLPEPPAPASPEPEAVSPSAAPTTPGVQ